MVVLPQRLTPCGWAAGLQGAAVPATPPGPVLLAPPGAGGHGLRHGYPPFSNSFIILLILFIIIYYYLFLILDNHLYLYFG